LNTLICCVVIRLIDILLTAIPIDQVPDMINLAISCNNMPIKAWETEIGLARNSLYKLIDGTRKIPEKAFSKLSDKSMIAACAVATQTTGFKRLFAYRQCDRHPQSLIVAYGQISENTKHCLYYLPRLILDKQESEDFTEEEKEELSEIQKQLVNDANMMLNLIIELDNRYETEIIKYLKGGK
jgi:hypothetical protein